MEEKTKGQLISFTIIFLAFAFWFRPKKVVLPPDDEEEVAPETPRLGDTEGPAGTSVAGGAPPGTSAEELKTKPINDLTTKFSMQLWTDRNPSNKGRMTNIDLRIAGYIYKQSLKVAPLTSQEPGLVTFGVRSNYRVDRAGAGQYLYKFKASPVERPGLTKYSLWEKHNDPTITRISTDKPRHWRHKGSFWALSVPKGSTQAAALIPAPETTEEILSQGADLIDDLQQQISDTQAEMNSVAIDPLNPKSTHMKIFAAPGNKLHMAKVSFFNNSGQRFMPSYIDVSSTDSNGKDKSVLNNDMHQWWGANNNSGWVEFELPENMVRFEIKNRQDCCKRRLGGARAEITFDNGTTQQITLNGNDWQRHEGIAGVVTEGFEYNGWERTFTGLDLAIAGLLAWCVYRVSRNETIIPL